MNFSWVPFYRELAGHVLEFEKRQDELLAVLREMKNQKDLSCVPLFDNQPDGPPKPLEEMDPFTFMANPSRVETASAIRLCEWLKRKWDLRTAVPIDFDGRAYIPPRGGDSWFFGSVKSGRQPGDIGRMWALARQAFDADINALDIDLLQTCMRQDNVGFYKMTKGLSWFSPEDFLPLNNPMVDFLKEQGISLDRSAIKRRDATEYVGALRDAEKIESDFPSLVVQSHKFRPQEPSDDDESKDIMPTIPAKFPPLNQILYGPPGTGKTYNVVRRAVRIIEPDFDGDFKTRFEELRAAGRIGFVTFHQSFSYEEFIEGLRPVLDEEDGPVRYEIRDGVLKVMALAALNTLLAFQGGFDLAWGNLCRKIAEEGHLVIEGVDGRFQVNRVGRDIEGEKLDGRRGQVKPLCEKEVALAVWDETLDKRFIDKLDVETHVSRTGVPAEFMVAVINEISREIFERPTSAARRFLDGDDNFVLAEEPRPRYVLIIDEINRGNISKILGELITLLEDDKRLGAENELRLTLPVSGETFALPPNLFILGTMNTADKSLAGLDVALRRRFSFEEMTPDFGVCDGLPAEMRAVLERLNERIEWAIDREHRLGHAAWMGVRTLDDFNEVWREKVMPLLVELFADNLETLRDVLGDGDRPNGFVRPFEAPSNMGKTKGRTRLRLYLDCADSRTFDACAALQTNLLGGA